MLGVINGQAMVACTSRTSRSYFKYFHQVYQHWTQINEIHLSRLMQDPGKKKPGKTGSDRDKDS